MSASTTLSFGGYSLFSSSNSSMDARHAESAGVGGSRLTYYAVVALLLLLAFFFRSGKPKGIDAPFYKASKMKWIFDAENLIRDSYTKFYNRVYQIKATEGVQVLIPPSMLPELKGLPEETLSAVAAVQEALMTKYTKFTAGHNADLLSLLIRTKLSQNLARLVPKMKEEIDFIVANEFPECQDWTPVKVHPFALRTVTRMTGRAFVGPSANRNEEWMDTSINYAVHVFIAAVKLQFFPSWMRSAAQYIVSELGSIRRDIERATKVLQPLIEERLRDMEYPCYEKPDDFLQWLLDTLSEEDKANIQLQVELQLILSAASIQTTNSLVVDCLYDLAAHPDIQEELREEANEVLNGDGDGWARKESMARLKKMDSFIKEVQRFAGNVTTFIRKVLKPIDLADGTHLPPGTKVLSPLAGMSHDERYYPAPEQFDALRFYRLRKQGSVDGSTCVGEENNRYQFTSVGDSNYHFGAGKHACPGRFFAGNQIKMILAYFLLNYDLKLKDGDARPKSMGIMMSKTPDPNKEIMIRRRTIA